MQRALAIKKPFRRAALKPWLWLLPKGSALPPMLADRGNSTDFLDHRYSRQGACLKRLKLLG
jgi:hypothetical protein